MKEGKEGRPQFSTQNRFGACRHSNHLPPSHCALKSDRSMSLRRFQLFPRFLLSPENIVRFLIRTPAGFTSLLGRCVLKKYSPANSLKAITALLLNHTTPFVHVDLLCNNAPKHSPAITGGSRRCTIHLGKVKAAPFARPARLRPSQIRGAQSGRAPQ